MQDNIWREESILNNRYQIIKVLPQGTLGQSYRIKHLHWNMPLRLKYFFDNTFENNALKNRESWQHFVESWIRSTEYIHLANAYFMTTIDNKICLVSDFIEGISWAEYSQQEHDVKTQLQIALQLISALQELHNARLVHGDLKESNIFINTHNIVMLHDISGLALCPVFQNFADISSIFHKDLRDLASLLYTFLTKKKLENANFQWDEENLGDANIHQAIESCYYEPNKDSLFKLFYLFQARYASYNGLYSQISWIPTKLQIESLQKQAFAYMENGECTHAEYLWKATLEASPYHMNALWNYNLSNLKRGILSPESFIKILEEHTGDNEHIACLEAEIALEFGCCLEIALQSLQKLGDSASNHSKRMMALVLYRLQRFIEAKEIFLTLATTNQEQNNYALDCYYLAITFHILGDLEQARIWCNHGLEQDKNSKDLQLLDAQLTVAEVGQELAAEKFQILADKYPNTPSIMTFVAEFYAKLNTEESKNIACSLYSDLLSLIPRSQRILHWYIQCGGKQLPNPSPYSSPSNEWSQIRSWNASKNILTAITMTSDNKYVITGDSEGKINIWDVDTGNHIQELVGHSKHITTLTLSPDNTILASGSWDQNVYLWDVKTGETLHIFCHHLQTISSIRFSSDGKQLSIGSWDGKVSIWNLETYKEEPDIELSVGDLWITDILFLAETNQIITCDEHERMCIWDLNTKTIVTTLRGLSAVLSKNQKIAISSRFNQIEIWKLPIGRCLGNIPTSGKEICLALTEDNNFLLTRNEDDALTIWDIRNCRPLTMLQTEECLCATMNQDGNMILAGHNNSISLWENVNLRMYPLEHHSQYVNSTFHEYEKQPLLITKYTQDAEIAKLKQNYATAYKLYKTLQSMPGYDHTEQLMQQINYCALKSNYKIKKYDHIALVSIQPFPLDISAIASCQYGAVSLLGLDDKPIQQWNLRQNTFLHSWDGRCRSISCLAITPDGSTAISGSWSGKAILWRLDCPNSEYTLQVDTCWITAVSINDAGTIATIGTKSGRLIQWNLIEDSIVTLCESSPYAVTYIKQTLQDETVVAFFDGTMTIWDKNKESRTFRPSPRKFLALDISPSGKTAIGSTRNENILYFDLKTGDIIKKYYHPEEVIQDLHFINESTFISISHDASLRLWSKDEDFSLEQIYLQEPNLAKAYIVNEGFSIITTSNKKVVKLWDIHFVYESEQTAK